MTNIKALVFDDVEGDLEEINLNLQTLWERFRFPNGATLPALSITSIHSVSEMNQFLSRPDLADYAFFLSDLLVGEAQLNGKTTTGGQPELHGFRFLKRAKERGVGVCVSITYGEGKSHRDFTQRASGFVDSIDLEFLKDELYGSNGDESRAEFIEKLVEKLQESGALRALAAQPVMEAGVHESRTQAILDEVGQRTIDAFAATFALPGSECYTMRALAPGLSGSKILLIEYGGKHDFTDRPIVIKLSRDLKSLQSELTAYKEYIQRPLHPLSRIVAKPVQEDITEINGWHALVFCGVRKARSLLDWITSVPPPSSENTIALLTGLYTHNGLRSLYKATRYEGQNPVEQIRADLLTPYRKMAIQEALDELAPLIGRFWNGPKWNSTLITNFLEFGRVGLIDLGALRWPTSTNICHNDFHARNILVQLADEHPELCIIDLASMKRSFWATDTVRLTVDLALSGWDHGPESYDWSNVNRWAPLLQILQFTTSVPSVTMQHKDAALQSTLLWLRDGAFENNAMNASKHLPGEYNLALAVELLRASYRKMDLPAPKRAFALVAAAFAIESAERNFVEQHVR